MFLNHFIEMILKRWRKVSKLFFYFINKIYLEILNIFIFIRIIWLFVEKHKFNDLHFKQKKKKKKKTKKKKQFLVKKNLYHYTKYY